MTARLDAHDSDDDLMICVARTGDANAFSVLVRRHQSRLIRFAARMLAGDIAAAEDVAQEAFVRLWRSREHFEPRGRLDFYLLRIVHNLCLNKLPRGAFAVELNINEVSEPQSPEPGPEQHAQHAALAEAVRHAVGSLPPEQRAVFVLHHYEHLRYDEIAEMLGCPPGTVASRKHLAVAALRRALKSWKP